MKVLHIITGSGLYTGGAERTLFNIATRLQGRIRSEVIALTRVGPFGKQLLDAGVDFISLGMSRGPLALSELPRLSRLIADRRPDIVQTWMYHADLLGGIAARMANVRAIVWNIRSGNLSWSLVKATTILTANLCARLSHFVPQRIICCSARSRDTHARRGYAQEKLIVIPNGCDLSIFYPQTEAGAALREELHIPHDSLVIGCVSRWDPLKDIGNLLEALRIIRGIFPRVQLILCGLGLHNGNRALNDLIGTKGLHNSVHCLGGRTDVAKVYSTMDLLALPSRGEAFPNVVAEAMACGVPCVVTDVGDSALIVQDTGKVVRPRDPARLAQACCSLIEIGEVERRRLGRLGRARIKQCFSITKAVERYEALYEEVI
jgi:glycosyltransferase involved in cell wall biosynthesis